MSGMRFTVEPRIGRPAWLAPAVAAGSVAAGLSASALLFLAAGADPLQVFARVFAGSFGSLYGFRETVTKAIPLALAGAGICLAFRARAWNIGAEGQILLGATGAALVALHAPAGASPRLLIPAMYLAGGSLGAFWAWIPALLRTRFGVSEAIASLLLNYVAADLVQYLIYGPLKMSGLYGMPQSDDFPPAADLPTLGASRIHLPTLALALLACLVCAFILRRTRFGFELALAGDSPGAARYAGVDAHRTLVIAFVAGGLFAGFAGAGEAAGIHHRLAQPASISSGYGYTAILVAALARLDPLWLLLTSLFFGGILVGGDALQTSFGLPAASVHVFNGAILLALAAGEFLLAHRVRRRPSAEPAREAGGAA